MCFPLYFIHIGTLDNIEYYHVFTGKLAPMVIIETCNSFFSRRTQTAINNMTRAPRIILLITDSFGDKYLYSNIHIIEEISMQIFREACKIFIQRNSTETFVYRISKKKTISGERMLVPNEILQILPLL